MPTADNTHEVAQRIAPTSRVVYVDNDPMVMAHARALMEALPSGSYLTVSCATTEFLTPELAGRKP